MTIRPFHFKLQKIDGRAARLSDALFSFLPRAGIRHTFHRAAVDALTKHIGCPVTYRLEGVSETTFGGFSASLPDPACLVVIGMPPLEAKVILDCELGLARSVVDRMLGGQREVLSQPQALSDIEQGVLEYALLQFLASLHRACQGHPRVHWRFEKFLSTTDGLRTFSSDLRVVVLTLKLALEKEEGFVRLCFPHPLIEGAFVDVPGIGEERRTERAYLEERWKHYDSLRVPLWAEVGRTALKPPEIKALETGDVILLDRSEVHLAGGKPQGKVILRTGLGREGGVMAEVTLDAGLVHCRLESEYRGE